MYRIVLTHYKNHILFSYQLDDASMEIKLFDDNNFPVGSIFNGRVSSVKKNIEASFVDLADGKKGFLPGCNHHVGDMIAVQIDKDGTAIKEPRLTEDISIAGDNCVVFLKKGTFKVSSKIPSEKKKKLLDELLSAFPKLNHMVIIRTNAADCDFEILKDEICNLLNIIERIEKYSEYRSKSILYMPDEEWYTAVRNIYKDKLDEIVTDDCLIFEKLKDNYGDILKMYNDELLPLCKLYSLETRLKEATSKKVWLKCGGFLFIEPTEALVSVDVNSGKVEYGKNKEETVLKVNLEAAVELARQLRLRNLSGIIIVDFINMKNASDDALLLKTLRDAVLDDPIKTQIHGMTSLGLVEITRMKGLKTLYEQSRFVSDDAVVSGD